MRSLFRPRAHRAIPILAVVATALLTACSSSGTKVAGPSTSHSVPITPPTTSSAQNPLTIAPNYHPTIDAAKFTSHVTNPYFALTPGNVKHYKGVRDGQPTDHVFTVTGQTKTVLGVPCVVISDVVTQNQSLVEKTTDWYAQDSGGNVWYFGEDTAEYQNGVVTSTAGTWEAGVDGAQPGIVMPAHPVNGSSYRQEYRPGVALDEATILSTTESVRVPAGSYRNAVMTFDKNPLDPSKMERKWYVADVGFVRAELHGGGHTETTELVK